MSLEPQFNIPCTPPPGALYVDIPGARYHVDRHSMIQARANDIAALEAAGCHVPRPGNGQPAPAVNPADLPPNYPSLAPGQKRIRLLVAPFANRLSLAVDGRTYSVAAGSTVDAPESDARVLAANGWKILGHVGRTEERPAAPSTWDHFLDTSIGAELIFDGRAWRNTVTGKEA